MRKSSDGKLSLIGDPMPSVRAEDMKHIIESVLSPQDLVDIYVDVWCKYKFIEDVYYDFEENDAEYDLICNEVDGWGEIVDALEERMMKIALDEGVYSGNDSDPGSLTQLEALIDKYGYLNHGGWWVKK